MTITSANRHLYRPSTFTETPLLGASVDSDSCALFLRAYDIEALQNLLRERGIPVTPVNVYSRLQGHAAKRPAWLRDTGACIPKALLLLCTITQSLDPSKRVPNPLHPSHPEHQPPPPRRMINGRTLVFPWDRILKRRPLPLPNKEVPVFPFRERDGSRFEPFELINASSRTGAMKAWLPRAVRDRLAECGTNFRDQGVHGPHDPTGKLFAMNRSAGMRRLLEAVRTRHTGVDLDAPLMFRGIELTGHTVKSWKGYEWQYENAKRHIRGQADLNPSMPAAVPAGTTEFKVTKADPRAAPRRCYCGNYHCPGDCSPDEAPVEQPKRTRPPRQKKLRKDSISEFNPDELG